MANYANHTIKKYLDDLAARLPAPGGGSSAALAGAMASALISMVLNFTIGNEKYKDFEETAKEMLEKSESYRNLFMVFFEADMKSYDAVTKAYKLPKDTEENKAKRKVVVQQALKEALVVPMDVCRYSLEALRMCPDLARYANKNLICDVEVPMRLLEAAFYSAKINVVMNQKGIEDAKFNAGINRELEGIEEQLITVITMSKKAIAKVTA